MRVRHDKTLHRNRAGCIKGRRQPLHLHQSRSSSKTGGISTSSGHRSEIAGKQEEEPQNKPNAGDANVVSTVRGSWRDGDFDSLKRRLRGAPDWEDDMRP